MIENKRFKYSYSLEKVYDCDSFNGETTESYGTFECCELLNKLNNENEQLKQELKIYRRIASCSNCKYQNYNWFEDGDEFEICEKGNNDQQIEYHICKEWEEFE